MGAERRTAALNLRIRPSVKALAKRRAEREGRSLSNYLEELVIKDAQERGGGHKDTRKRRRG